MHLGLVLLAQHLQFLGGEMGHDGELLFVHQELFPFDPKYLDVAFQFVRDIHSQLQGHIGAFGEVSANNYRSHFMAIYYNFYL